jgi:C-terminal processing protease CtpA/Prc
MTRSLTFIALTVGIAYSQLLPAPQNLGFEEGQPGNVPPGWRVPTSINGYAAKLSSDNPKTGKYCAEVAWTGSDKPSPFGNLMQIFDAAPYRGKRVRFRAAVRATGSDTRAQLWFREDRADKTMGFLDNMDDRPITKSEWQYYDSTEDVGRDAAALNIGMLVFGHGSACIDDVSIEIVPDLPRYTVPTNAAFDKLTSAAKLWVYVKYFHPRVTAPGLDWDQAFVDAAPDILASKSDSEFALALDKMLTALHDPATHVIAPRKGPPRWVMRTETAGDSVHVVRFVSGTNAEAMAGRQAFTKLTANGGTVVFDLRGMGQAADMLNYTVSLASGSGAPPVAKRVHWGYAAQTPTGYQGYYSAWETRDGQRRAASQSSTIRPVFLIDQGTPIPAIAIEAQNSGTGAILCEGPMHGDQMAAQQIAVGNLSVAVRTEEIAYRDGTTGVGPNLVLNRTGEDALAAAVEIAKQGKWPAAPPREKLALPPAMFQEKSYSQAYPSAELRMLAAARIWGVFQYFHPYKYLYGEDWDAVLADFLPKMAAAKDKREYNLTVAEMVTHTHDTHCYITSPELGSYQGVPSAVEVRWIEEQPVVTRVLDPDLDKTVHAGDVVAKINGEPIQRRIDELSHYFTVSNENSLHMRVMQVLLNGPASAATNVTFRGADGKDQDVLLKHDTTFYKQLVPSRKGDSYRLLNPRIGYVDLDKLTNAEVDAMFDKFQDTTAIIMDMRGYPQGTAWSIAPRLATQPGMVNAQFRTNIVTTGGESAVRTEIAEQRIPLTDKPRYKGKTVLLIDDRAMSQSEHSGLMYKTANGTVFIGSGTAGANGDVTAFPVPGGIRINFSGHDVRWLDGKQLQRVGLVPDIEVKPTIAGIRSGRDEILERAMAFLESSERK